MFIALGSGESRKRNIYGDENIAKGQPDVCLLSVEQHEGPPLPVPPDGQKHTATAVGRQIGRIEPDGEAKVMAQYPLTLNTILHQILVYNQRHLIRFQFYII